MKAYCDKQELKKKSKDELVNDLYDSLVEIDKLKRELRKYKNRICLTSRQRYILWK